MTTLLAVLGVVWIVLVAVPVGMLLLQVAAGARAPRRGLVAPTGRVPAYVVLMPAHDEVLAIRGSVAAVLAQLAPGARLLVIADNCTDATAAEARAAGAEVVERCNPLVRGKGHALAYGIDRLRHAPPEVVVILDADCIAEAGALDLLASTAAAHGRPVQALYLMLARRASPLRVRMAAFAWAVRNQVRPLGLHRLGLPCQLMGSGMALPWACTEAVDLASGHLTEDLQLGLQLAAAGHAPRFCPAARVKSWFPQARAALDSQRRRWEHGHLSMIVAMLPALVARAWRTRSAPALALALDLCVPPLALLALLVASAVGVAAALPDDQAWARTAAAVAGASAFAFAGAALLGWWSVGRRWVGLAELLSVPWYVLAKLPVYAGFVLARQKEWVRTARRPDADAD